MITTQSKKQQVMSSEPLLYSGLKVAYIMSRFPKLTETFILFEILAMRQLGVQVEIYPLLREPASVMHPEAATLVKEAHYQPFLSWPIVQANWRYLWHQPRAYLGVLWALLRGTWGSWRFFTGAIGIFPKSVYFAQQMTADHISHIHAHFASHPTAAAFVIHRLTGIPYSFTAHGSDIHRDQHMLREKVAEAAFVVPISAFNREVILKACGGQYADKLVIIHCGVDIDIFTTQVETAAESINNHLDSRPFTVLCIGTLHEVKGQTYLIEACRLLCRCGVSLTCHFIGDGPDLAKLTEQANQAGLVDCIHFHGRQTRAEIARQLQTANVVVAPSVPSQDGRREGIPVALMEAMASGVPVIASRLSGIPELVKDGQNGLLIPPGDAAALADALYYLYEKPHLRYRLGQAGRDRVLREFDLRTNVIALAQRFHGAVIS